MQTEHVDIRKHVRLYLAVFAALLVLTLVTVGVSYVEASLAVAVAIALVIATLKGSLVAGVFMHLAGERRYVLWCVLGVTVTAVALIGFMALSFHDTITGTEMGVGISHGPAEMVQ